MRSVPFIVLAVLFASLAGCTSDPGGNEGLRGPDAVPPAKPDLSLPPAMAIPATIKALVPVAKADVPTGAGIAVYGHHAYVPARGDGFFVVDISSPDKPRVVGNLSRNETFYVRYVEIVDLGERLIAVGAGQSTGMHFIDVTDPTKPDFLTTLQFTAERQPSHNVVTLPGTTLVYNTPSTGTGGVNHIVDLADPDDPQIVGKFGDHGCHLTDVRMDLKRAYCAGVQESQIWDITDPLKPSLVGRVDHPLLGHHGLHHQAIPNWKGDVLMVTDEFSGGGAPGSCLASVRTPIAGDASTPFGALWFFDVADERNPKLLNWFSPPPVEPRGPDLTNPTAPPTPLPNCTGHIGRLVPGREQILVGWYTSGVVLVDFSDPTAPYMVTRWNEGTNTWDVEIYQGWVFTGDIARGLDVLKFG